MKDGLRKGWCPTLRRPMQTGDGLLVRLPLVSNRLTGETARRIAQLAKDYGNGFIDLSARGNLQLRGVTEQSYAPLVEALTLFCLPALPMQVLISPLAGIDSACDAEVPMLADMLKERIASDSVCQALPPKFLCIIDGGGALPMADVEADIRFEALSSQHYRVAIGGDAKNARVLGVIAKQDIAASALALIIIFVALSAHQPEARRIQHVMQANIWRNAILPWRVPHAGSEVSASRQPIGPLSLSAQQHLHGVGLAYGRMDHVMLSALADIAERYGDGTLIVAPWRTLLLSGVAEKDAEKIAALAFNADFIVEAGDARRMIHACPGMPSCSSALGDTRLLAESIARALPALTTTTGTVHVSGCAKGCAWPRQADLTITAEAEGYALGMHAKAGENCVQHGLSVYGLLGMLKRTKEFA